MVYCGILECGIVYCTMVYCDILECAVITYPVYDVLSLAQSAEILYRDGAAYPECVEISAKGHALEAIEASTV